MLAYELIKLSHLPTSKFARITCIQRHDQEQTSNYLCCTGCLAKWSCISLASYLELALATALLHSAQLLAPSKWAGNWKVTLLTSMRMSLVHGLQMYPGSRWPGHAMVNKAVGWSPRLSTTIWPGQRCLSLFSFSFSKRKHDVLMQRLCWHRWLASYFSPVSAIW